MKTGGFYSVLVALALFASAQPAISQSKTETKNYNKTVKSCTVANCRKFLSKFPDSVYAPEIGARLDTLLNISPYIPSEAAAISSAFLPEGAVFRATGYRRDAVDMIIGLCIDAPDLPVSSIRQFQLESNGKTWSVKEMFDVPLFADDEHERADFVGEPEIVDVSGVDQLVFRYEYHVPENGHLVSGIAAYDFGELSMNEIFFDGRPLPDGNVEGRFNDKMVAGMERPVMKFLLDSLKADSRFIVLDDAVIMTDDAIAWWLEKNPDAMTGATTLKFGVVPPESSLAQQYSAAKGKQNSSRYRAAMFDIRGYSVVVAYNKSTDEYVLVWAEPECRDHYRDRLLNNIYFQSGSSTLVLFYYKGRRTFEYHVNLSNKTIRRS